MSRLLLILKTLRVHQWTKNLIVLAPFLFALGSREKEVTIDVLDRALEAILLFCLVSSGIYIINDLQDREADRNHPTKKLRPIASGAFPMPWAIPLSCVLMVTGLSGAWYLSPALFHVMGAYVLLQLLYTYILKRVALIDVFIISFGFVLRALAGAVVIDVPISPWLLLCTLLLALFLGLCKRRHEKIVEADVSSHTRPTLLHYDEKLLDQLIAIVSPATIVCYALYTLWPDTVEKFGTMHLGFTIPFVIFGLFRYLDLVYRQEQGGRPEKILLTDWPIIINLLLYGVSVVTVLFVV